VYGDARVYGDALVYGDARVYGDALVNKKFESVNVTNLNWSITSLPKGIQVGCHFRSYKEWKEKHVQIGLENGLTEEESKAYFKLFQSIRRIQHLEYKKQKANK
jgi:hypothetical protein